MKPELGLLGLLVTTVAAAALPQNSTTTDLKDSIFSDIMARTNGEEAFLEPLDTCLHPVTKDIAKDAGVCKCWGFGLKSRRAPMISAIEDACAQIKEKGFGPGGEGSHDHHFHTDRAGVPYVIRAKVIWAGKALGHEEFCDKLALEQVHPDGPGPYGYKIPEPNCKANFMTVVDRCDTNTENDKYGGYAADKCFIWWLDPNPTTGGG